MATICFGLGVVQKSPCVVTDFGDVAKPKAFSHMCYSDIQYLYLARGLAEGVFPYTPTDDVPASAQPNAATEEHQLSVEYPVLTGVWMGVAGMVTHAIGRNPDLDGVPHADVQVNLDAQFDSAIFWGVNAIGFFIMLLLGLALLVLAQRRRPWDAMYVAAAPAVALTAMINWDMLALAIVAGIFWAWSTRRPVLTGILIGVGTATKLYPLFILGPLLVLCFRERKMETWAKTGAAAIAAWLIIDLPIYFWSPDQFLWFWQFNASRGPDLGSVWGAALEYRHVASPHTINIVTWVFFGACCIAIAALGLLAQRRPRLPQLVFLVTLAFLLVNKVYSPQYVLWLLPLAALARPRWRDLLIWQACEVLYFFAVWMHLAGFFVTEGDSDWAYVHGDRDPHRGPALPRRAGDPRHPPPLERPRAHGRVVGRPARRRPGRGHRQRAAGSRRRRAGHPAMARRGTGERGRRGAGSRPDLRALSAEVRSPGAGPAPTLPRGPAAGGPSNRPRSDVHTRPAPRRRSGIRG